MKAINLSYQWPHIIVLVLATTAMLQLALLYGIPRMPGTFLMPLASMDLDLTTNFGSALANKLAEAKLAGERVFNGESIALAQSLGAYARMVQATDPQSALRCLSESVAISKRIGYVQEPQGLIEAIENLELTAALLQENDKTSSVQQRTGRERFASLAVDESASTKALLEAADLATSKSDLIKSAAVSENLRKILLDAGLNSQANALQKAQAAHEETAQDALLAYEKNVRDRLNATTQGIDHADFYPFCADSYRNLVRSYASAGRTIEATEYENACLQADTLLPNSEDWRSSIDYSESALLKTELHKFVDASKDYSSSVQRIYRGDNPDPLLVLPQLLAQANLQALLRESLQQRRSAQAAAEIEKFFAQLKSERNKGALPSSYHWAKGDLVQVRWDDRWWSAQIVENFGANCRVHFVGLSSLSDDSFSTESIRQHPPYGFPFLQNEVPDYVWKLAQSSSFSAE